VSDEHIDVGINNKTFEVVLHHDHIDCVGEMGLLLAKLPSAGHVALSNLIESPMVVATGYRHGCTTQQAT